jgi:hypothetical protein
VTEVRSAAAEQVMTGNYDENYYSRDYFRYKISLKNQLNKINDQKRKSIGTFPQ